MPANNTRGLPYLSPVRESLRDRIRLAALRQRARDCLIFMRRIPRMQLALLHQG